MSPNGEHAGRFLAWVWEEEEDGGGEEAEVEAVLALVEETVLALVEETVLVLVEGTVFEVLEEAVLALEEEECCFRVEGGEFSRFPKSYEEKASGSLAGIESLMEDCGKGCDGGGFGWAGDSAVGHTGEGGTIPDWVSASCMKMLTSPGPSLSSSSSLP